MMLHPRGYGDTAPRGFNTHSDVYDDDYLGLGSTDICPDASDVVTVDGFDEALVYAFKPDNQGPHYPYEASTTFSCVKKLFPDAEIIGSTFDDFISALVIHGTEALPIIRDLEMGDTW